MTNNPTPATDAGEVEPLYRLIDCRNAAFAVTNPISQSDVNSSMEFRIARALNNWRHRYEKDRRASHDLVAELLAVAQMAYRKHHMGDDSIGWEELSDKLGDALNNAMGPKAFVEWMQEGSDEPATR